MHDHPDTARGDILAEQHDEWTEGRRYLGLDVVARSRLTLPAGETTTGAVQNTDTTDEPGAAA